MNTERTLTDQITATTEGMRVWQQERVIFEITERICELMDELSINRSELAERLGTSRGYISQLLNGTSNMTIRKICDVYFALGRQFHAGDRPISVQNGIERCGVMASNAIAESVANAISQLPPESVLQLAA